MVFGYFFILMLSITLQYIPLNADIAFLQIKQTEVTEISYYLTFFYIHVYSAIFALIAGFTQFNKHILNKYTSIHSIIGKLYVYVVLFLAAPSGLVIGYHANGGLFSKIAFVILSILWFYFTLQGIIQIKNRNIILHKSFMLRSFALAFSAVTLRIWKVILVYLFQPSPMDVYQIIAWLGWTLNLLVIEVYIYKKIKK
jgi:Predicted membrane protein (DUF2306)